MSQWLPKELQSSHTSGHEEEIAHIQSQMTAGKPQEKEWIPEEVELKSEKRRDQI